MKLKSYSIRRYLTFYIFLAVVLLTVLSAIGVYANAKHEVEEVFDATLAQSARILKGLLTRQLLESEREHLQYALSKQNEDEFINYDDDEAEERHEYEKQLVFQVWDADKTTLLLNSPEAPRQALAAYKNGYSNNEDEQSHSWHTFVLYSSQENWWIMVGENNELRDALVADIVTGHIVPFAFLIPCMLGTFWILIKRSLQPLNRLSKELQQRHYQALEQLDDKQVPEEALSLVSAMNQLFRRLDEAYRRESRFAADVAHELRNPLAALTLHADNAIEDSSVYLASNKTSQPPSNESQNKLEQHLKTQREDLLDIRRGISRLSHLVQQLLALSRAELELQSLQNLSTENLIKEACKNHQAQAQCKQQQLNWLIHDSSHIQGDHTLLLSMLGNLINNALLYTPEKGQVRVSSRVESGSNGRQLILQVDDSGPGIKPEEQGRVKDRFYRTPGTHQYGAGLGLSIVETIADKHGGHLDLGISEWGGLRACIVLPINYSH